MDDKLPEIPSEILEPHIVKFFMQQLESIAFGFESPKTIRAELRGVEHFISMSGGIHSRLATSNEFHKIERLSDDKLIDLSRQIYGLSPLTKDARKELKKSWKIKNK